MKYYILTPFQQEIFETLAKDKFICDNYRFVGGTALSEFYLHHRLSDDLDFFTLKDINLDLLRDHLANLLQKKGINTLEYREIASAKLFFLRKGRQEVVKTEFSQFPYGPIDRPKMVFGLKVDSLLDITLSKLDAILNRKKARDFIDFFFIQQKQHYPLDYLIRLLEKKVEWHIDPLLLASRFFLVDTLRDYPKMLVEFSEKQTIAYFHGLSKELKNKIVK